jgi:hypothetical protein
MTSPIVRFAAETLGFELFPRQAAILDEIYTDHIRTAVLRFGRRSGKGRIAAVLATFEATVNAPVHLSAVSPGEQVAIVIVATNQKQAGIVHGYIKAFLRSDRLAPLIARDTQDRIELTNGVVIMTLPCDAAAVRGLAIAVVVLDEAAWFAGLDGSPLDVAEIWDALYPATIQFPEAKILVTSTPRSGAGWFAELCERAATGLDPTLRTWHASTAEMNLAIPPAALDTERAKDPDAYRREYEAEFDAGVGAAFPTPLVRAAVRRGPDIRPPLPGHSYVMSIDQAFTGDVFAAAVGHRDGDMFIVDLVVGWQGTRATPLPFDATLDQIAELARAYNAARVRLDQFAAQPIIQGLTGRGVEVIPLDWTNERKATAVAATRTALISGHLELPNHGRLINELIAYEGHQPAAGGRPRFGAPGGGHDDYASALLGLVDELGGATWTPEGEYFARRVWRCQACGHPFGWDPRKLCPKCGTPSPDVYDHPAPPHPRIARENRQ